MPRPNYLSEVVAAAQTRSRMECWPWPGKIGATGYGPHLTVYRRLIGPVPKGLELDHLCRNRACVNPFHLEPVTRLENQLRGNTITAANVAKTHCPRGHVYDELNTLLGRQNASGGRHRICKTCNAALQVERARRYYAKLRGGPAAPHNRAKTHCVKGHEFTAENITWRKGKYGRVRVCRACMRDFGKQLRERQRAKK